MSKARTLANLISDNAELADGQISVAEVVGAAPLASPTFTGTVTSTGNIALGDDDELVLGSNRMRLYYSASNNYTVLDSNGTSGFVFDGVNNLSVNIGGSLSGAFTANGVSLYSGGTEKLQVYGSGTIALDDIKVNDDVKIGFGQFHTDLELYHDSATSTNKLVGDLTQTGAFTTDKYNNAEALPDIRPSLLLDFANSKTLDPRITFSRGSTATYWDGHTTTKAEENLLRGGSEELNNSTYWDSYHSTVTANATTAPDGTTTAEKLAQQSGTTNNAQVFNRAPCISGTPTTFSIYAKAGTRNFLTLREYGYDGNPKYSSFNLSTGAVGTTDSNHTSVIQSVGNGWYRCSLTFTGTRTASDVIFVVTASDADGAETGTDDGGYIYAWGAQVEHKSSVSAYTKITTAPIVKYQPTLQTAASGEARFDHDPVTGESKGLLIEEARTNFFTHSSAFGSEWSENGINRINNQAIAPDGTLSAEEITYQLPQGTGRSYRYINAMGNTAADRVFSVFIKNGRGTGNVFGITWEYHEGRYARYDFDNATASVGSAGHLSDAKVEDVGNGWFRFSVVIPANSNPGYIEISTGLGNMFVWGFQLEQGAFPTSYIPTSGSTVTRSADGVDITGSNFTSWFGHEATSYVELSSPAWEEDDFDIAYISSGSTNNRIRHNVVLADPRAQIRSNATNYFSYSPAVYNVVTNNSLYRAALAYSSTEAAFSYNGVTPITDSSVFVSPELNQMNLTKNAGVAHFRKFAFYPQRLSNATLQAMTEA